MKYIKIVAIFFVFIQNNISAQTVQQYLALAETAAEQQNYAEAAEAYKIVLEDATLAKSEPILWATAENCRLSNAPKEALVYYKRIKQTEAFPNYNNAIGMVYKQLGDYKQAEQFLKKTPEPTAEIQQQIAGCSAAATPNTEAWRVEYLKDKDVNAADAADYFGFTHKNAIFFGSNRSISTIKNKSLNVTAIYFKNNKPAETLRAPDLAVPTAFANACLGNAGKWLIFSVANYNETAHKWQSKLRYVALNSDEMEASDTQIPQKLQDSIFENATMPHWAVEAQRIFLYFVSDREGGKGGLDIWRSAYENGTFEQPENMPINTAADDITPFYHAATETLYFSSKGRASQGGYDIYAATNYTYSEPKVALLPAPLNSSYDDFYFGFAQTDSTGYLSSTRSPKMLKGENGLCCADIFKFSKRLAKPIPPPIANTTPPERSLKPAPSDSMPSPIVPNKITQNTPETLDTIPVRTKTPIPPIIIAKSNTLTLYFHNDEPDPKTVKTTTTESYDQTYFRYIAMRKLYVKEYLKGAPASEQSIAAAQIEAFFEQEVIANFEQLQALLAAVQTRLTKGETVRVHISGHCSPLAANDYNIKLSKRRIACMQNYLRKWQNGSLKTYINKGNFVIEQSPFGETTAPTSVSDNRKDKRNSIFSPEASAERRVTLVFE